MVEALKNAGNCHNMYVRQYDSWSKFKAMFHKFVATRKIEEDGKIIEPKTFVIDSCTILQEYKRLEMFKDSVNKDTLKIWGEFITKDIGFALQLQCMPMNVIVNFHDAITYEGSGTRWIEPLTYGNTKGSNMPRRLPSYFKEFYFCDTKIPPKGSNEKREYNWITASSSLYITRTISGLPTVIPQDFSFVFKTNKRKEKRDGV